MESARLDETAWVLIGEDSCKLFSHVTIRDVLATVEDVPSEEMYAALEDSDFEDDEGEQGEEDESETEEDIPTIDVDYGSETTEHSEGSEA